MAEQRLLTAERERRVLDLLRGTQVMKVSALSEALGVSEATVRRDLQSMHERRLLHRVRGGASLHPLTREEPLFHDKEALNAEAKHLIAESALRFISDHDQIYLDGGSTVLTLARLLGTRRHLTIVTNSLMAAQALADSGHRLFVIGGEFRPLSRTVVGPLTASVVQSLHVDKAFMGTIGLTLSEGMTTTDPQEAFTKELVMKRANQTILLADSSKIEMPSFARSGSITDLDVLITERISEDLRSELETMGVQVVEAGRDRSVGTDTEA
jgi:DeoR/GlpR family transcriptional regulator of sugar metabolism